MVDATGRSSSSCGGIIAEETQAKWKEGQEGGRLWEHPFQGRPRVNPTVKRGKEEKTHLLRRHRPSPGRIQDPLYTCIVYM